jgi:homoserine O-acetyltransferase/O-succinyltransferase
MRTWQRRDIGLTEGFDGDTERALRSIQARAIVMPAEKGLYLPPEDNAWEVERMSNAELRVIPAYGAISQAVAPTLRTPRSSIRASRTS